MKTKAVRSQQVTDGNRLPPFEVSRGSVTIRGYWVRGGYWQLVWYGPTGARERKTCTDEADARSFASAKAAELSSQTSGIRTLTAEESIDYDSAVRKLPEGVRLTECVDYWLSRHPANAPHKRVGQVVEELLADLGSRQLSRIYLRTTRTALEKFSGAFNVPIHSVTGPLVREYLRGLGVAPKTESNARGLIVRLFNFASSMRYVTRDHAAEIAEVEKPKVITGSISTWRPDELLRFLSASTPEELPAVVFLAFCPLRTAEIARLDWRDVRVADQVLIVNAESAKVSVRRVVPLPEAALAWLMGRTKTSGAIWPDQPDPEGDKLAHRLPAIAKAAGVTYRKNILRHSCISALMATQQDAARVALWAGNSPRIVSTNYHARWTRAEGEYWFKVRPPHPAATCLSQAQTTFPEPGSAAPFGGR